MRLGFRARLLLAATLPAVMVVALLLIGFLDRHTADLEQALGDRGRAVARQMGTAAEFPLFAGNREALDQLVSAARGGDNQIKGAALLDSDGQLHASSGEFSVWTPQLDGVEQVVGGDPLIVVIPINRSTASVDDIYAETALAPTSKKAELLGYAVLELSREALESQRRDMLWRVLAITAGALVLAAVLSTMIAGSVTRPIEHISEVVARIKGGELSARTLATASGVLEPLAAGINDMAERIAFTQEDLRHKVVLATEELRQQKEAAEYAARVDTLTGVANRRAFDEIAESEVQRALRYGTAVSLIMIDLDHFKTINDSYGHQAGDAVLVTFARTITEAVREVDVVGRWGGEEFLVLLPGTGATEALRAAERMRGALAQCDLRLQGRRIRFTASFGVAEFIPAELSLYSLLDRLDAALYRAKAAGRDRVELAAQQLIDPDSET
jgi:diguanylate cyclase (GGDEF)-like protein